MKKILLAGGSGFIGHNLAIYLKKKSYEVLVLDSLSVNNLYSFNNKDDKSHILYRSILQDRIKILENHNIKLIVTDIRDHEKYNNIYQEFAPDIVIHLAAVSHANKSNKDPHYTFDNSLRTLENTLDICKAKKTHVIFFSSSMVYGNFTNGKVSEETICKPLGIYGNLKYVGELIVKSFNQVFGLPYTIIRPSALYGERCVSRRVGQVFIEKLVNNEEIIINGDGSEKLDFTYIEDLIDGIEKCCDNEKAINQTFNLTYGNSRPVTDLIEILKNNFENVSVLKKPKEEFMPERGTLDNSKAKELIGFSPKYPIEVGYKKYIDWYKNFCKSI